MWNLPHQIWVNRWIETMSSLFANPTDLLISGNISLGTDGVERQITLRQSMACAITLLKVLMESKWGKTETWRCRNHPYNTITWTTGCFYMYSLVSLEEVKIWSIKTQTNQLQCNLNSKSINITKRIRSVILLYHFLKDIF